MGTTDTKTLHTATITALSPSDDQGPYFWLSPDGEMYLEVAAFPSNEAEAAAWYDEVAAELVRKTGGLRIRVHRRLLAQGGAEFDEVWL